MLAVTIWSFFCTVVYDFHRKFRVGLSIRVQNLNSKICVLSRSIKASSSYIWPSLISSKNTSNMELFTVQWLQLWFNFWTSFWTRDGIRTLWWRTLRRNFTHLRLYGGVFLKMQTLWRNLKKCGI